MHLWSWFIPIIAGVGKKDPYFEKSLSNPTSDSFRRYITLKTGSNLSYERTVVICSVTILSLTFYYVELITECETTRTIGNSVCCRHWYSMRRQASCWGGTFIIVTPLDFYSISVRLWMRLTEMLLNSLLEGETSCIGLKLVARLIN